ncbi:hypothetical protein CCUS01_04020 [Colletotrichum cuscutae]|uniref:Uncharacterized protein n=1 Tax=Colletotrichum cuscutae TaxID=1209917 RepID=A0AAI9Y741_9PEZI|nr:hypothetical protein CCUS01_04020 [Colletotrichum cuscutae]
MSDKAFRACMIEVRLASEMIDKLFFDSPQRTLLYKNELAKIAVRRAAKFGAYYWAGSIYCIQATFFAWANDSMQNESPRLRSCVIACMNAAGNCFQAWWPLIFYRAEDAPEFKDHADSTIERNDCHIAVGTTMAIWVTVLILVEKRRAKMELQVIEAVVEEQSLSVGSEVQFDRGIQSIAQGPIRGPI